MAEPDQRSPGLMESARRILDTGLAAVQNRLELFATELREEKCRLIEILVLASIAVFMGMMAVTFVTLTIVVYFFRENALVAALICVSLFYLITGVVAGLGLKHRLTKGPIPFNDTLAELKKDRECLRTEN